VDWKDVADKIQVYHSVGYLRTPQEQAARSNVFHGHLESASWQSPDELKLRVKTVLDEGAKSEEATSPRFGRPTSNSSSRSIKSGLPFSTDVANGLHTLFGEQFLRFKKRGNALPTPEVLRISEEVITSADEGMASAEIEEWLRRSKLDTSEPLRKKIKELDVVEVGEIAEMEVGDLKQLSDAVPATATKKRWVWVEECN
jgi:hypothetical protein